MEYDIIDRLKMAFEYCVNHNEKIYSTYTTNKIRYVLNINDRIIVFGIDDIFRSFIHLDIENMSITQDENSVMITNVGDPDFMTINKSILENLV